MNEIKFRIWDKKDELLHVSPNEHKIAVHSFYEKNGEYIAPYYSISGDELIFQLFTGLKDKNGKEIYEGDIIKWSHGVEDIVEVKYIISKTFNAPYPNLCYFAVENNRLGTCHFQHDDDYVVIGNIFENVELLQPT